MYVLRVCACACAHVRVQWTGMREPDLGLWDLRALVRPATNLGAAPAAVPRPLPLLTRLVRCCASLPPCHVAERRVRVGVV